MPAANSFTTVPISLEALTASDHAIVVPFPIRDEIVACGDIGGTLTEAGALMVGTSPQGKTRVSGIAYLSPGADPAARFAAVLAGRDSADCLAGPLAGSFVARGGQGAGVMTENFSATVTFVNPMEQTETPWDFGFAFHRVGDTFQSIYVDSKGFWYYQGTRSGFVPTFDATSGATNTLDLVVEGNMARFGVNREFVGSIDLPPPTASDVYVGTGFFEGHDVEGREIRLRAVEVW